jgi:hypothetical protein
MKYSELNINQKINCKGNADNKRNSWGGFASPHRFRFDVARLNLKVSGHGRLVFYRMTEPKVMMQ